MVLYIDKENLLSLVESRNHPSFESCEKLIRNNMDIHCNFSKEEIVENDLLQFWFSLFGQGVGGKVMFCPTEVITPDRPLKTNFYNSYTKDQLSSIYLLNENDKCDLISLKSCILIGKIGEEISTLEKLMIEGSEIFSKNIDWNTYCPQLPLTDIIICDNHYFKNKEVYDLNNHELLRKLSLKSNSSAIKVIIITKEGEIDTALNIEQEQQKIKEIVRGLSGNVKSAVTILTTRKIHDRNMISNYFRIKNGSCFHVKNNGIKGDVTAEVKSHAIKHNNQISIGLLSEYQSIADNPVQCFGDRVSNYLNFQ